MPLRATFPTAALIDWWLASFALPVRLLVSLALPSGACSPGPRTHRTPVKEPQGSASFALLFIEPSCFHCQPWAVHCLFSLSGGERRWNRDRVLTAQHTVCPSPSEGHR